MKSLAEALLVATFITHILCWVLLFAFNSRQGKIEDQMRAQVTQPEYYLLKWETNPKWLKIEKVKNRIYPILLITGGLLLLVGFIANAIDGEGSCYNRYEDYCTGFE
jgi:hypothetical protein